MQGRNPRIKFMRKVRRNCRIGGKAALAEEGVFSAELGGSEAVTSCDSVMPVFNGLGG